jgi:transmembrane channel-like protein
MLRPFRVKSSEVCGPFRDHEYMYQVFMEGILRLKHDQLFFRILISVTKPAVVGGVILTLCVIVYYLRAKSRAQIAMVGLLREMLFFEAKDKEFLLSNITKLTHGKEWLFGDEPSSLLARNQPIQEVAVDEIGLAEPSKTWRYRSPKTERQPSL